MTTYEGKTMQHILAIIEDENRAWMTISEELENVIINLGKVRGTTFEQTFNDFLQEGMERVERDMCLGVDGTIANIEIPE